MVHQINRRILPRMYLSDLGSLILIQIISMERNENRNNASSIYDERIQSIRYD